jgi:hypothetical protein
LRLWTRTPRTTMLSVPATFAAVAITYHYTTDNSTGNV